jgi:hypothetical protein
MKYRLYFSSNWSSHGKKENPIDSTLIPFVSGVTHTCRTAYNDYLVAFSDIYIILV